MIRGLFSGADAGSADDTVQRLAWRDKALYLRERGEHIQLIVDNTRKSIPRVPLRKQRVARARLRVRLDHVDER